MSSYAKSYYKYGRQTLNDIVNLFDQIRKKKENDNFYNSALEAYKSSQDRNNQLSQGFDPNDIKFDLASPVTQPGQQQVQPTSNYGIPNLTSQSQQPNNIATMVNKPETPPLPDFGTWDATLGDYIPKTQETTTADGNTISTPSPERYNRSQANNQEFLNSVIPQILNSDNLAGQMQKINALASLLNQQTETMKPVSPETFNLGQGQTRFQQFPGQEPQKVAEGAKKETPASARYERIETFDVGGKPVMRGLVKGTNQWEDIGTKYFKPDKKDGSTSGSSKETGLKDSASELVANLKNIDPYERNIDTGEYRLDNNGNKIKRNPDDIKFEKDKTLEKVKLQLLSPRSYQWIVNIQKLWQKNDPTKEYLSPQELGKEAIKHAQEGNLTEKEQNELATYLKYYNSIYPGLIK